MTPGSRQQAQCTPKLWSSLGCWQANSQSQLREFLHLKVVLLISTTYERELGKTKPNQRSSLEIFLIPEDTAAPGR
jgi:hypothetical protein